MLSLTCKLRIRELRPLLNHLCFLLNMIISLYVQIRVFHPSLPPYVCYVIMLTNFPFSWVLPDADAPSEAKQTSYLHLVLADGGAHRWRSSQVINMHNSFSTPHT